MNNYIRDPNTINIIETEIERQVVNDEMDLNDFANLVAGGIFDYFPINSRYNGMRREKLLLYIKNSFLYKGTHNIHAVGQQDLHLTPGNTFCYQASILQTLHVLLKLEDPRANYWIQRFYIDNYAFLAPFYPTVSPLISDSRDDPQILMNLISEHEAHAWNFDSFYESIDLQINLEGDWIIYDGQEALTPQIVERLDTDGVVIADLDGFRDQNYRDGWETHFVVILEHKLINGQEWFLISDSDAEFNGNQGQFLWISSEVIEECFIVGNSMVYPASFRLNDYYSQSLVEELRELIIDGNPVNFNEDKMIAIVNKYDEDRIVWLEYGTAASGLLHILKTHLTDFWLAFGLKEPTEIAELIMEAVQNSPVYSYDPQKDLYVYQIGNRFLGVVIGSNGYIVTAHPISP